MPCIREVEDFHSPAAARSALTERGFKLVARDHYRHPERKDDGYWQRADVFVPFNHGGTGRVAFWPATA